MKNLIALFALIIIGLGTFGGAENNQEVKKVVVMDYNSVQWNK